MAIFENELGDNVSNRNYAPKGYTALGSTRDAYDDINVNLGGFESYGDDVKSNQGMSIAQLSSLGLSAKPDRFSFKSSFSMVPKSELLANQRYPLYERGIDLENIYGLQQSGLAQLGNGLIKAGATALGTFGQSFATIPNTISALKSKDVSSGIAELSGKDGYEAAIDDWTKNLEDRFPNYVTRYEKERGLATAIPFTYGSANFWGDKIIKNTGFMVGAIGGAIVQDLAIGYATAGIGSIPLVAAQLGKASLYLNKLFAGANKVDKVLDAARAAGKSTETLLKIERLGQLAAAQKLNSGFRYGMATYGAARTEAAIESRESYNTVKEQLISDYRLENGVDPTGSDLQEIENYATNAMNTRFGINMALLTISNAVQFDNLFKTFTSAQKGLTSSTIKNFQDAGKYGLKEGSLDVFEKKLPTTFTGKVWDAVKPRAANIITEGVYEEGGQFAAKVAVDDYYTRKYKNKESWDFVKEAMESSTKALNEQFGSAEGIESMLIGGITAALTGEAISVIDRVKGQGKNQRLETAINTLNQYGMTGILSQKYEDTSRGMEIARQMQDAVKSNNIFKYKNLKADMLFNFVNSRIPAGMHDVTIEQLQMLKDLPKEEFEKTFGMDFSTSNKQTVEQYVDAIIKKADSIKDTVEGVNAMFTNPFRKVMNPKTDDERMEFIKYGTFENWKTDVASLSYIQQDVDARLFDIQSSVTQVSPYVNNDVLRTITNEDGLKELNNIYEQKANLLSETLSTVEPSKRAAVREEIKKLRTLSEKISMSLSNGSINASLFNTLLNFEINGQDFSKPNLVSSDKVQKLVDYSEDINKLTNRKINAEAAFDNLTSEKGFDQYFEQSEQKKEQEKEEVKEELSKPEAKEYEFVNKAKKPETPIVGREYQLANALVAKMRKAGDQYKVVSPTGEVKYYDTKEEAKQAVDDLNVDFSEITKVKVLALNPDGTLKVEDLAGNIQNLSPKMLEGYEKLQTEEEKLGKDKETLDKQQDKLEQDSASVPPISPDKVVIIGSEDKRKDVSRLFLATTSPSEDNVSATINNLPHIKRVRKFFNNLKFFKGNNDYKVIIVTPNNAKELGLDGIVQMSYNKPLTDVITEEEKDVQMGFMAQVFIMQTPEGDFFVNEKGEKLSKVGDKNPNILNEVIFETMSSASLTTVSGESKVRAGQEEEAEKALEAYKIFREELFAQKGYDTYSFSISRGIPRENKINGQKEDNPVSVILGDDAENLIANQKGLIKVVTTGKVEHDGELLSYPLGTTLIQYKDLLDFANNKKLTNKQSSVVFKLVEEIANDLIKKSNLGQPVKINYPYSRFLQNILYWKSKDDTSTPSQIRIDTNNMTFDIGGKSFPLSKISENRQQIMDVLQEAFITTNNNTLSKEFNKKFTEYRLDKNGNLVEVEWKNYQSYLLSSKNPDGSTRSIDDIPLITHTAAETDALSAYKQKYAYITDKDVLPYEKVPVKEVVPTAAPQKQNMIGKYEVNTGKVESFEFKTGNVLFSAKVSPEEIITVDIKDNETITKLSTDAQLVAAVDSNLRKLPAELVTIDLDKSTNEQKAKLFVKIQIESELGKLLDAQKAAPAVQPTAATFTPTTAYGTPTGPEITTASTAPVSDTRADIERRRGEFPDSQANTRTPITQKLLDYFAETLGISKFTEDLSKGTYVSWLQNANPIGYAVAEKLNAPKQAFDIIAKYGAELDALEEAKPKEDLSNLSFEEDDEGSEYRLVGNNDVSDRMTNSDLEEFVKWHAENASFIPFEILEQMIKTNDGREAWGVFEKNVAKFVRGGLRGTEYHEVFEFIWADFLTPAEKEKLLSEFRNKKGEFTDRASGKKIAHEDATDKEAKERIADDFSDFRVGKLPARTLGEKIRKFFKRIMDFFKSFVSKPSLKEELFKQIDKGRFKETKPSGKIYAPEYRIDGLTEQQTNELVQDMVIKIKLIIFGEGRKDLLFNPEKMTGEEVLSKLRMTYETDKSRILTKIGENRYNQLVKRSLEFLRTIGLTIDVDEVVSINGEEVNNREYAQDPFSTDWKKYSSGALKFMLSTMSERKPLNQTKVKKGKELKRPLESKSDKIKGNKLLNFSRVFATLLDRLHNTNDVDLFVEKLVNLAKEDSNYLPLFSMLGGNRTTHTIDFENFKSAADWALFIQFYNTFSRQKPNALIQYTTEDFDIYTSSANVFSTENQTIDNWISNMKMIGRSEGGLINFDKKVYKIDTAAIKRLPIKKSEDQIKFLNQLGIEFDQGTYDALSDKDAIINGEVTSEVKIFTDAVGKIYTQLGKNNELMTFDAKRLDIGGQLRRLASLYIRVNNPNQDSTYFGVEGQRISSFSENNTTSYFENDFNESDTLDELLEKRPELRDVFSRGSEVLKKGGLFFDINGKRIAEIKLEYIQGSKNEFTGKDKSTARLDLADRYMQEINQNINGKYYVLVPGDSSTEWMMNLGNVISMEDVLEGKHWNKIYNIFNNYLIDEVNLALEDRKQNLYTKGKSQELRFMKDVLPENIVSKIESMIEDESTFESIKNYISDNQEKINSSINEFITNTAEETFNILLENNKIIPIGEDGYYISGLDTEFSKKYRLNQTLTKEEVIQFLTFANSNYEINNIEFHKFIFGDPYQFKTEKGKLDETKRIKSYLSPRRRTFDHPEFNNFLKRIYSNVEGIELEDDAPGNHEYKSYVNTMTFDNVKIVGSIATLPNIPKDIREAFEKTDETDAFSWMMDNTFKELKLKEGKWFDDAEKFHQWHMAYTRKQFAKKGLYEYKSERLKSLDEKLTSMPIPEYKLAVLKPIISGNKNNKTEIDLVLDKTSQIPLYYHMVEGTALEQMYIQMFKEKIGYGIVLSGRKVGAESLHSIYNEKGEYNDSPFTGVIEVPWKIYGTQVETMFDSEKQQTRGSQLTKLSSMDLYNNGEPISESAKNVYEREMKALNMLNQNAYNELLNKLGVEDLGTEFTLLDGTRVSETLMYEMMRRELSENAKDTIKINPETGEFSIPFEASPSYGQIKSILYALVNNALISPKMSGAPHVQTPVTMWESSAKGRALAIKTEDGWEKITKKQYEALTEEEKKKVVLTDDTLKFYTPNDPYCEVMLPNWFAKQLKKGKFKNYTDEQLINYLNNTSDGKKILSGIGFRIPTQALSSMEVFRVKAFLPEYMGYTVVVPSEITTKAGSDFDIDKLNMYLKSIYLDESGEIKLVSYKGSEQATKDFYAKVWENTIQKDIDRIEKYDKFRSKTIDVLTIIERASRDGITNIGQLMTNDQIDFYDYHYSLLQEIIYQAADENLSPSDYIVQQQAQLDESKNKLALKKLNEQLKENFIKKTYKQSLENEYYEALEQTLTLPENFDRLISPINDAGLEKISQVLDDARGYNETGIKGRLINRNYMTNLRHAFITGKRWVGIAAVNITNLSLRQKSKVYLDDAKVSLLPKREQAYVQNLDIVLPHNTVEVDGKTYTSLSGTTTNDGTQFISDRLSGYATAFVDIANNPFITKIVKSDTIVSTFMFLEAIGAGNDGIFFLNQPIIEKFISYLDSKGSKNVLNNSDIQYVKDMFPTTMPNLESASISVEQLLENIKEYSKNKKFDALKNAEQQLILDEFIKYKILADQLFNYTQALNYDTTRFANSDSYLKKLYGTVNAANYNIISNVNDVLDKTFIGEQSILLDKSYNALGAILKTEHPSIKKYMLNTIKRYATKKYMSMDDYEKIANLIKNSFIDYIIQNDKSNAYREMIKPLLVDDATSVATQLEQAKLKYPSIKLLQDLVPVPGNREGSATSIKLKVNTKSAYDENLYTGMMRELRDTNEELNNLYNNLINVAILQGTSQSAISIRNIIPVEDYSARISPIISQLVSKPELEAFENAMFERNNFSNKQVFQDFTPNAVKPKKNEDGTYNERAFQMNPFTGEDELVYWLPAFKSYGGSSKGLLVLNDRYNSFQLSSDFIRVPKVITTRDGEKVNIETGFEVTPKDYAIMKKKGSLDLYDAYYYKKVYTKSVDEFGNPIPLTTYDREKEMLNYYYKLINVYGDGNRAVEMNTNFTPSEINNGSKKITRELTDDEIVKKISPQAPTVKMPVAKAPTPTQAVVSASKVKVISPDYGVVQVETNPTDEKTKEFINLIRPQIQAQTYKENKGRFANEMFHYGLMWARNNPKAQPIKINKFEGANNNYYNYHALDQKGNALPSIKVLQPIIDEIQKSLGIDMSDYDSVIGNIYLDDQYVYPHKDTTESVTARNYPVVVYTIGNDSGLGIVDDSDGKMTFTNNYDTVYLPSGDKLKGYTNEILTKNGTIYTFGMDGKGRFELTHSTPTNSKKTETFPPITLPNGKVVTNYTITLTFRRAADLEPGMPKTPAKLGTQPQAPVSAPIQTEVTPDRVTINLQPDNREAIVSGRKTTTIRTQKEFEYIGLPVGATARTNINGVEFNVTNRGLFSIDEVGRENILASEGLSSPEEFKFPTSKKWFAGEGKLYVYDFQRISEEMSELEKPKASILDLRNVQIDYTSGQRKALTEIADIINKESDGYYLLAGYAGTGKTTIAENIAKYAKEVGKSVLVIAPTNKAAKVLNDKLKATGAGSEATTIHKTIYGEPDPETGEWVPTSNIKNSVIIVDESSMIDQQLMADLIENTKGRYNTLIFMGDSFQLEPVGSDSGLFEGKVSQIKNETELTEVKRQSLDSDILKVATLIRTDKKPYVPKESTKDFIVTNSRNQFVENFKSAIKNNEDVAMIVATNSERILMNKLARNAKFGENSKYVINPNETVISVANSSDYSNSEIFKVNQYRDNAGTFELTFTDKSGKKSVQEVQFVYVTNEKGKEIPMLFFPSVDKPSVYHAEILKAAKESNPALYQALDQYTITNKKGIKKLSPALTIGTYGYAITAHKSQGSQWEKVFVNQNYSAPTWNPARWFYTAITRAAKEVEVLPSAVNIQISNQEINSKLYNIVQTEVTPGEQLSIFGDTITLKDGKEYNKTDINSNMLEAMGYTPKEIGKILKQIC